MKKFKPLDEVVIGKPTCEITAKRSDIIIDSTDHFAFWCNNCNSAMKISAIHHYPQQQQVPPYQSPCTKFFLECANGHRDTKKTYWDGDCEEVKKTEYIEE